ncbi:MAG TPA: thiolase family protein [Opitutaceae bacterium]|jgi:acetyl-CoA C-acetyltransferase|nr:thiolase family protein [Opitutaceae bacterium]
MVPGIVIAAAARTPLGAFQGGLAAVPAPQLGAAALGAALRRCGQEPQAAAITDVFLGQVLTAGAGQAPARQAALKAGLPASVRCVTVNKVCGSGLEAIIQAARLIAAGESQWAAAGGMENMSLAPYLLPNARQGWRLGHQTAVDSLIHDGLWDPGYQMHMGACAERCAEKYRFSREEQDAWAAESFRRARAAQTPEKFGAEIAPVGAVAEDEGPARFQPEKMRQLKPAFADEGTITAANASSLNDGAAAVVLAAEGAAPSAWARIVSWAGAAQDPLWFTTAPIAAAREAARRAGWPLASIDLFEVNEAFAVVPLAFARDLEVDPERLNVRGGAIALGHPIGASGARIVVTLLHAMRERGARRGLAALCIGGGEGLALCLERIT